MRCAMIDPNETTAVLVITPNHRVTGRIALVPGARLTDYVREHTHFVPMVDVVVSDLEGHPLFKAPFLDLSKDHIELILPQDSVTFL